MNKSEKILESIRQESNERIAAVTAEADRVYREAIAKAEKQAEEIRHSGEHKVQLQSEKLIKTYKSRAELERRNVLLKAKRNEIEKALVHLHEYLLSMPDNEYFEYIIKLAETLDSTDGMMYFNSKDLKRMPKGFRVAMLDHNITAAISDVPDDSIDGGFILKNGDIEENMTFSAMIADRREELEDIISRELFRD